jgi:hypothetical protein
MSTQFRARFWPEIFAMRDSGLRSMGPYFSKSIFGHGRNWSPPELAAGAAVGRAAGFASERFT